MEWLGERIGMKRNQNTAEGNILCQSTVRNGLDEVTFKSESLQEKHISQ
jgi:hypothetical protein